MHAGKANRHPRYHVSGMADTVGATHDGAVIARSVVHDQTRVRRAFAWERQARTALAEHLHDETLEAVAAAVMMIDLAGSRQALSPELERARTILESAWLDARRCALASITPLDRSLRFTLTGLLEQSGSAGRVEAPDLRYHPAAESDVYCLVQDVLLFAAPGTAVDVRVVERGEALLGVVRGHHIVSLAALVESLDVRFQLVGGWAISFPRQGDVTIRFGRPFERRMNA